MLPTFSLELLQAVNDWQRGHSSERQRARRADALKQQAVLLPDRYRKCSLVCFRQIALKKAGRSLWELMAEERLPERISSWTMDVEVAMTFKGGVPPEEWQGIIFADFPAPDQIVVNLSALYADRGFRRAVQLHRQSIKGFYDGVGKYDASQSEVVIERDVVSPNGIYTMGGYSSDRPTLARLMLGRDASPAELQWLDLHLRRSKLQPGGPWWLSPEGWKNVYGRVRPQIMALKESRRDGTEQVGVSRAGD